MRRLRRVRTPRVLILMYHRVVDLPSDPQLLAVSPDRFSEHLHVIRKLGHPISLAECVSALGRGSLPNRSVVITFDDGYADNLRYALPRLEHYEVPATIFVTSGRVGHSREFWWDELERIILQPGTLPEQLTVPRNGGKRRRDIREAAAFTSRDFHLYRTWHVEQPHDPHPRHRLYRELYDFLFMMSPIERERTLMDLFNWADIPPDSRSTNRALTEAELIELDRTGLIEIGAHTVSHPSLPSLNTSEQDGEIRQSKRTLEDILEHPVRSFSYPHGFYDAGTTRIAGEAGFESSCTTQQEPVWPGTHTMALPRMTVRNWGHTEFAHHFEEWLRG
jgi:peptidoglycan/xylan/chitin deacetylase (PgdA/CDA1 family)